MKKLLLCGIILLISSFTTIVASSSVNAEGIEGVNEENGKTISLVASCTGATKDEATKCALRSALEQAFGTFVSANTQVVNDELVKDEIVSISSGNIKKYNVISCVDLPNGGYDVSVKAEVSIGNLVKFAQNHGMSTELSGNTFLMNRNIAQLNKDNEINALNDLIKKIFIIVGKGVYDFSIDVSDPKGTGPYYVRVKVNATPNENMINLWSMIEESLNNICMTEEECDNYRKLSMNVEETDDIHELKRDYLSKGNKGVYKFRNYYGSFVGLLKLALEGSKFSYQIYDNLETVITPYIMMYQNATDLATAKGLFHEWSGFGRYFGVLLDSNPSENPNSDIDVVKDSWHSHDHFDIVYTEERLKSLKNISIRPNEIRISQPN